MEDITLICGDCLEVLPTLADNSVDAVITDPPYGAGIANWDESAPPQEVLTECLRIASGPVVWFGGRSTEEMFGFGNYAPRPDRLLMWNVKFCLSSAKSDGMYYRWHPIWCWRLPEKQSIIKRDVIDANTEGHHVWGSHPATKPLTLMTQLVNAFGNDLVLDPFMGSGTTGVVCIKTGRKFIGIEIDETYFKIAQERIAKAMVEAGRIDEMPESLASSLKNPAALSLY